MLIDLMAGLGDTVFARPIVRHLAERNTGVAVRTAWPQLMQDLAYPLRTNTQLRTQAKNIARDPYPKAIRVQPPSVRPRYGPIQLGMGHTALSSLELTARVNLGPKVETSLPMFESPYPDVPVAVIRPATIRREWPNTSRNPRPDYLTKAARILRLEGYFVVSVADIAPPYEIRVGPPLDCDARFDAGELMVEDLIGLIQGASVVVGGVGFIVPVCIATKTPLVVIGGGQGAFNAPDVVVDPRVDSSRVRFILPDHYCRCQQMIHGCRKTITDFGGRFAAAVTEVAVQEVAA